MLPGLVIEGARKTKNKKKPASDGDERCLGEWNRGRKRGWQNGE